MIARHGRPVVELRPAVAQEPRPVRPEDLHWLAARRVGRPVGRDAGRLVTEMRDDDDASRA